MLTTVMPATANRKVRTASTEERGAACFRSASFSALPPSNSTTTKVNAAKYGAIWPSNSRVTQPDTGPRKMPATISSTTSGNPVF